MSFFRKNQNHRELSSEEIERMLGGNDHEVAQVFSFLHRSCYTRVSRFYHSNSYAKCEQLVCSDLFSEVLTNLQMSFRTGRGKPIGRYCAYLVTTVHRLAMKRYTAIQRKVEINDDSPPDALIGIPDFDTDQINIPVDNGWELEYYAVPHPEDSAVMKAFFSLGKGCQDLFTQHILNQQSLESIAERMEINPKTLWTRYRACLNEIIHRYQNGSQHES